MNAEHQVKLEDGARQRPEARLDRQLMAARMMGRPVLLDRTYARQLYASLAGFAGATSLADEEGPIPLADKMHVKGLYGVRGESQHRPYHMEQGVAVIPVNGPLMHKWPYLGMYSAGYGALLKVVSMAVEDSEVDGILLDMDTPGGEVAGCFDTSQRLRELSEIKPIGALCNDMNLSAGMCLASAASRRFITQTGEAGSVGVVMAHFSYEEWDKKDGLQVTLIYSGERKVDGNMYQNLPEEVFALFQNQIHDLRHEFADIVGEYIGMESDDVLATEAGVYRGQAAIDVGFADELVNGHEAIPAFLDYLSSQGRSTSNGVTMSDDKSKPADEAGQDGAQPAGNSAQDDQPGLTAAETTQAAADERERIQGILGHEEAQGRSDLANHLAFKTDMTVEAAAAALAASGVEDDSPPGSELDQAMQNAGSPGIGADAPDGKGESDADRILGAHRQATGRK
ncbi:MAG: S49 family peptidase [Halioglobus sp.]